MGDGEQLVARLADGLAQQEAGDHDGALAIFEAAVLSHPGSGDAHHLLGVAWLLRGEPARAEIELRRALAIDGEAWAYHVNLANARDALGDDAGAEAALRDAQRLAPERPEPACNLGGVLTRRGDLSGAIEAYASARAIDPTCAAAWEGLCFALVGAGRSEELASIARAWLDAMPEDPVARWLALGPDPALARAYFERFAPTYDAVLAALHDRGGPAIAAALRDRLGAPRAEAAVLDVGCGTGRMAAWLRSYARELHGVDLSGAMLQRAPADYDAL